MGSCAGYRQSKGRNLACHLLLLGAPSFFRGPMEVGGHSAQEQVPTREPLLPALWPALIYPWARQVQTQAHEGQVSRGRSYFLLLLLWGSSPRFFSPPQPRLTGPLGSLTQCKNLIGLCPASSAAATPITHRQMGNLYQRLILPSRLRITVGPGRSSSNRELRIGMIGLIAAPPHQHTHLPKIGMTIWIHLQGCLGEGRRAELELSN